MATPAPITTPAPAAKPGNAGPAPDVAQSAPDDVPAWQSQLDEMTAEAPAAPAATPPTPPVKPPAEPAKPPAARNPFEKPAEKPAAPKPGEKPPAQDLGRKSKLDPDEMLNIEAVDGEELPEELVKTLGSLDARDLRLQSAKLAKSYRKLALKTKEQEIQLTEAKKPREDLEKKTLLEQTTALQKRLEDTERELRFGNYTKSAHYREKYEAPFNEALTEAYDFIEDIEITNDDGSVRLATRKDFDSLIGLLPKEAQQRANALFGEGFASRVLGFADKLRSIRKAANRATEKFREEGDQVAKERMVQEQQERAALSATWKQANEELPVRYRDLFGEVEGDTEGNARLKAGYAEVDRAHAPDLTIPEKMHRLAAVRHRAAAFGREVFRRKTAEAKLAEAQATIKAYEDSEPSKGNRDGGAPPAIDAEDDPLAAIDRLATNVGG